MKKLYSFLAESTADNSAMCRKSGWILRVARKIGIPALVFIAGMIQGFCNSHPPGFTDERAVSGTHGGKNYPVVRKNSELPPDKKLGTVNAGLKVGIFRDSIVHLVWDQMSGSATAEIILERSEDGQNYYQMGVAQVASLIDLHTNNYPKHFSHHRNIMMSTESGGVRYIYNDIVADAKSIQQNKFYRVIFVESDGEYYVSETLSSMGASLKTLEELKHANSGLPSQENGMKGGNGAKAGCNPVETPPAGYTNTGQTQTHYGDCCYWIETLYSSQGPVMTNCGGNSYAWCCSDVPEAPSCPSGFASDPCCVHYCNEYDDCSCAPWQCCTSSLVQVWVVTESADYTPITAIGDVIHETCPGAANGSISLIVSNGTAPYTFAWSGGQSTQNVSGLSAGSYSVTVTDAHGCVFAGTYVVNSGPAPTVNMSPDQTVCQGLSVIISAGSGYSYLWSNGATSAAQTVTPAVTTTFSVTVTNVAGCSQVGQTVVTVNPLPVVSVVSSSPDVCEGFSSTLTASSNHPGTQFLWNTGWTTNVLVVAPPSSSLYKVTGTDLNGCVSSEQSMITVLSNPVVTSTSPSVDVCQGNQVTLSVSSNIPGTSYLWSNSMNTACITVAPQNTTVFSVTGTAPNGCTSISTVAVNVNPLPDIQIQASSSSVCAGTTATLIASGNVYISNFVWNNNQSGMVMVVSPSASTVYTVTGTDGNGCMGAASIAITVNPNPVLSLNALNQQMCDGNTATLNAFSNAPSTQYLWNTGAMTSGIQVSPHATTVYSVTGTDGNGCQSTSSITVTVYPNPVIQIQPSQYAICNGASAYLNAGSSLSGTSYLWNTGSVSSHIVVSPTVTTVYTVVGTMPTGCYGSAQVVITVNPNPSVSINANTTEVCAGEDVTLTASSATFPVSYFWNVGGNTNPVVVTPQVNTTYQVTVTDLNGCSSSLEVGISVHPLPVLSLTSSVAHLCYGSSATLSVSSDISGTAFHWNNGSYNSFQVVNPLQSTNYSVTGTSPWGCVGTTQYTLNVGAPVTVQVHSGDPEICRGSSATLTATGAASYAWSPQVTFVNGNGSAVSVSPVNNTTYSVTGTDSWGCVGTASFEVIVRPVPVAEFASDYQPACDFASVHFTDLSYSDITNWSWNFGDPGSGMSNYSSLPNPVHYFSSPGSYGVTLEVTTQYGCTAQITKPDMIYIYPTPDASFTASPIVTALPKGVVNFYNETTQWTSLHWYFGDPASGVNNTSTLENPVHEYTEPGVYTVWLYAENELGCYDSIRVEITVQPAYDVFIPNTFTPNGDGINDTFFPKGFGVENNDFEMYIFNRWGEEIFFTNSTTNPWNGSYRGNGQVCQTGVYPYILYVKSLSGLSQKYVGSVNLIK